VQNDQATVTEKTRRSKLETEWCVVYHRIPHSTWWLKELTEKRSCYSWRNHSSRR